MNELYDIILEDYFLDPNKEHSVLEYTDLNQDLYANENMRRNVLSEYFPKTLLKQIGYEKLAERIPSTFLRAAFAKHIAAQYFYINGINHNEL